MEKDEEKIIFISERLTYVNSLQILVNLPSKYMNFKIKCLSKDYYLNIILSDRKNEEKEKIILVPIPKNSMWKVTNVFGVDHLSIKIPIEPFLISPLLIEKERENLLSYNKDEYLNSEIRCRHCGEVLMRKDRLERVNSMPSKYWIELSEMWVCCSSIPMPKGMKDGKMEIKERILYDSQNFVVLNPLDLENINLGKKEIAQTTSLDKIDLLSPVSCSGCNIFLGEIEYESNSTPNQIDSPKVESVKLYKCFLSSPTKIFEKFIFESYIASEIFSSAEALDTFKFLVLSHEKKKLRLLINLVNWDSVICSNKWDSQKYFPVLKLFFIECKNKQDEETASKWTLQKKTETLVLPDTLCDSLLQILEFNNQIYPFSVSQFQNMKISFLRLSI